MRTIPLEQSATITLNANGYGLATITPPVTEQWDISTVSVTSTSSTKVPTIRLYLGQGPNQSDFIDGSYNGNQNVSDVLSGRPIPPGIKLLAEWAKGDANAIATVTVRGKKTVY